MKNWPLRIGIVIAAICAALLGFSIYQQACVEKAPIGLYPGPMPGEPSE